MTDVKLDEKPELAEIGADTMPETIGDALSVPSLPIDGLTSIFVSSHQVKVTFVEHHPTQEGLKARPITNFVMPVDQFLKITEAFTEAATRIHNLDQKA